MMRLVIIGGCKIAAVAIGLLSALTGLWWLVAADIALYALCVIEACAPSVGPCCVACASWLCCRRCCWRLVCARSGGGCGTTMTRGVGMGTATRVCVDNYEAYPGIFCVSFDSGDVRAAVVLTRPQLEQLRSCVTDSLARDDAVRRRRGGDL